MSMDIYSKIQNALTAAMKARDEDTKRTLRLVMSAIKLAEVEEHSHLDEGNHLDEARILSILQKEVKTREDAIAEAESADRTDLVTAAKKEIVILNRFLPKQMDKNELEAMVKQVIEDTNASGIRDMGEVMKNLMPKLEGRASGQEASKIVKELLQK